MSMNSYDDLQARYIAGDPLSSDEVTCLLRWLKDDPDKRHEMLIDESIDSQLHCLARLSDPELSEKFILETVRRAVASQRISDSLEIIPALETKERPSSQWFSIPVSLCAAVLVLVGIAITLSSMNGWNKADFGFARITRANNLSWELIDLENRRLRITSGNGEVHFENGTIAQFSAPAMIELTTPGSLFIETGSVKITVPPAAIGFTVETPIARIVDLGTRFDVDVGVSGRTETRVRSGIVTFETHPMRRNQSPPIKLTADGLSHATAVASDLTTDVRSVTTTASGSDGQFYGTIHADGQSVEFNNRQEYDDFLSRLRVSLKQNPSQFREQWKIIEETTANGASTVVEGSSGHGMPGRTSGGNAQEMLIEQLRSMQEQNGGNPQMQQLLEGMILQAEEGRDKLSEE